MPARLWVVCWERHVNRPHGSTWMTIGKFRWQRSEERVAMAEPGVGVAMGPSRRPSGPWFNRELGLPNAISRMTAQPHRFPAPARDAATGRPPRPLRRPCRRFHMGNLTGFFPALISSCRNGETDRERQMIMNDSLLIIQTRKTELMRCCCVHY